MRRSDSIRLVWRRPLPSWLHGAPTPDDPPFTRWEWFLACHPRIALIVEYIGSLYR